MKKAVLLFLPFLFFGCDTTRNLSNTPTKKVEEYLNKYQTSDESVTQDIKDYIDDYSDISEDDYEKLVKKHYSSMIYEIKEETIDGDEATVIVEINVVDLVKTLEEVNDYRKNHPEEFYDEEGNFSEDAYDQYRMEQLNKGKEKTTYTLKISLTLKDDEWQLDPLSKEERQKINGTYKE